MRGKFIQKTIAEHQTEVSVMNFKQRTELRGRKSHSVTEQTKLFAVFTATLDLMGKLTRLDTLLTDLGIVPTANICQHSLTNFSIRPDSPQTCH